MASSEERMRILSMLQEGKITAEEANRLLSALNQAAKAGQAPNVPLASCGFVLRMSTLAALRSMSTSRWDWLILA